MARIGVIYGSTTGNTRDVCDKLTAAFGADAVDMLDVAEIDVDDLEPYTNLIFAVSTWGAGDLQDDWEEFYPHLDDVSLSRKKVAIMGIGDQSNYPDTFADAVSILADKVAERNGELVGKTIPEGYTYQFSRAERDGKLLGLILDEDNQADLTDGRIKSWAEQLRKEFV